MTKAVGSNFTGCPCETFAYGCCPDGITVAEGPNLEGCELNCSSEFGCCSDGITPKVTLDNFTLQIVFITFSKIKVDDRS